MKNPTIKLSVETIEVYQTAIIDILLEETENKNNYNIKNVNMLVIFLDLMQTAKNEFLGEK